VRLIFLLFFFYGIPALAQNQLPSIGMWREHAPYQSTIDVTATENKIYAATPYNLFSVDRSTKEIERISKVSGLSETGISRIRFDALSKKLIIAYSNSNIDIIDDKGIHNVPGFKRANISGDKNIYDIYTDNELSYLSTGLGVLVLDVVRFEIKASWFIGSGGNYVKTTGFTRSGSFFYAATEEGLKRITANHPNPANFIHWQNLSGSNGLPASPPKSVVALQGKVLALVNDTVYIQNGINWNVLYGDGWKVNAMDVSEGKLFLSQVDNNGNGRVQVMNDLGVVERTIQQAGAIAFPSHAISVNNEVWVADAFEGLSHWTGNSFELYRPNSPQNIALGEMVFSNGILYASAGSVNDAWNYLYNRSGIFQLKENNWSPYNQYNYPQLDSLLDFITVAVDPRDQSVWGGSFGGGLLHIGADGQLNIYKQNSSLEPAQGDPGSYRVSGLAFDSHHNLWVSNYGASRQIHVRKNDGSWRAFSVPFFITENAVSQILIDDADQLWIVSPKNNGLIVFNHNNTLDDPADDKWRIFRIGAGAGNLPSSEVNAIAKDRSGFIWVATIDGIAVIQCPLDVFVTGCEAILPTIREGGFVNYLFKGESVRSIAVDGADRKWIATANGVWLVSAEGNQVIANFNETNSPLPSNDVKSIAINGKTGEVFLGTAKGIASFRGTATEAAEEKGNALVFPNPVPPGFSGTIGIRGLPENSTVKIMESNGRLVYQTRSLGGQANWNGNDYRGRKAAPGVYIVMAVNDNKEEKAVAKIVFIGR
jgi:ligand-binding sensor domain-containing protein